MGIGFNRAEETQQEEPECLYRRVIKCPICGDDELEKVYKGVCSCGNITIDIIETIARERYNRKYTWPAFKTVSYEKEPPIIYDVRKDERP
jgi:hypothetical protein